jgi:hypothetical protein
MSKILKLNSLLLEARLLRRTPSAYKRQTSMASQYIHFDHQINYNACLLTTIETHWSYAQILFFVLLYM